MVRKPETYIELNELEKSGSATEILVQAPVLQVTKDRFFLGMALGVGLIFLGELLLATFIFAILLMR